MSAKTKVFITGATGYVGGSVLDRLLQHHTFATSDITVLIRKADKAPAFESLGLKTILGSYDDHALLEEQASLSDVIFTCADSDNAEACAAILRGLKKRYQATGRVPVLIHTSGVGVIIDSMGGNPATEEAWDDTDVDRLDTIEETRLHRNVDSLIVAADNEGYVKTYIVLPSAIYGVASGRLVDLGVQNVRSIQVPLVVSACIARKHGGYVGKGLNVCPGIHIDDTAELYMVLYNAILEDKAGHGREGYYFGENGHHSLRDVGAKTGEVLHDLGVSETAEPSVFTEEDYKQFPFLAVFLGLNCMCKATRARALGWQPKYGLEDFMRSIRDEVERQLSQVSCSA